MKYLLLLFLIASYSCSDNASTSSEIEDNNGNENNGSGNNIPAPDADFTISSDSGEAPYQITFNSTSTGQITSYEWNIDDDSGIESYSPSFTYTYEDPGTYDVTLKVVGPGGIGEVTEYDAITITEPNTSEETGLISKTMMYDNENREYLIYIPSSYSNDRSTPILFAFHGFGGYNQYFINDADFRNLADQYNFIAVYPQGLVCNDGTTWNTHPPGGDNKLSLIHI